MKDNPVMKPDINRREFVTKTAAAGAEWRKTNDVIFVSVP
jgi:hypothetical protein